MKIEVRLNEKIFYRFSCFDILHRKKVWRSPAIFAAILCACGIVCLVMKDIRGAAALGVVLLVVGLGIPAAYFLAYFLSLKKEARDQGLTETRHVYTLTLHDDAGVTADNKKERADYPWDKIFHAYRDKDATYLYISAQRAFLIPHGCVREGPDALWALLERRLPAQRRTVLDSQRT